MGSVIKKITHSVGLPSGLPGDSAGGDRFSQGFQPGQGPDFTGQYNTAVGDVKGLYDPFVSAGRGALGDLSAMTQRGFTAGDFTADPGYQFTLGQGLQSVQNAAGVRGSPMGGQAMREMAQYSTGLANQTYQAAFDRWQQQLGNLQNLAGLGANAAGAEAGNLSGLFSGLTGAQANIYGSQAGVASSQIGRGGSFFGAASNLLGM